MRILKHETVTATRPGEPVAHVPSGGSVRMGTVLAERYRLESLLGRGGMGEVYRAEDLRLGQAVALKLLPPEREGEARQAGRLAEEVRIARRISHPNVCRVYDLGAAEGRYFVTMEWIDGEDLAARLARGRPPRDEALALALQICRGLEVVHEQGIVHRDLKPANIILDRAGRARLADFGIATDVGAWAGGGTLPYSPPEQISGGRADVASDLYALGRVLEELFTGRRDAVASPELEPAVARVLRRCLEKDPRCRPASAGAVAVALDPGDLGPALRTVAAAEIPAEILATGWLDDALETWGGREIHRQGSCEDGELVVLFERPWEAVGWAAAIHRATRARIGIDLGEVGGTDDPADVLAAPAILLARNLRREGRAGQTLLTRGVFELARGSAHGRPSSRQLRWLAHGTYRIDGFEEPRELFEVGEPGRSPLRPPREGSGALTREPGGDVALGWRPAPGEKVPGREGWRLERKLGEGSFGEVWLAESGDARRAFKFCGDVSRLGALRREMALLRLLREELGERPDIARVFGWSFDQAPYFIESEYTAGGSLLDWARLEGGLERLELEERLEIVAQTAEALAAAHSVGVLHKDVKPGNVLIDWTENAGTRIRLTDFGLGHALDGQRLAAAELPHVGSATLRGLLDAPTGGTHIYMAPEVIEGKTATVQADVYALGVMLYQMAVGDLHRALAPGWRREIDDELLRDDIAAAVDGDPERRLGSARELALRLRRREPRRLERAEHGRRRLEAWRARRLVERTRRRWRLFGVGMLLVALAAAALAFHAWRVAGEAEHARQAAEKARRAGVVAEQFTDFLRDLFAIFDQDEHPNAEFDRRQWLDRGLAKLEADEEIHDPRVRAQLLHFLSEGYRQEGLYDIATPLAEEALALSRKLYDRPHPALIESLTELARLDYLRADFNRAGELVREKLAMQRALRGPEDPAVVRTLTELAATSSVQGDFATAARIHREVLDILRRTSGSPSQIAMTMVYLARIRYYLGEREEGEELAREALRIMGRPDGVDRDDITRNGGTQEGGTAGAVRGKEDHSVILRCLVLLGDLAEDAGKTEEMERLHREALEMARRLYGDAHPQTWEPLRGLGLALAWQGEAEAMVRLQELREVARGMPGDEHPQAIVIELAAGRVVHGWGDLAAAESAYRRGLLAFERHAGPGLGSTGYRGFIRLHLARALAEQGKMAAAEDEARRARDELHAFYPATYWPAASAESVLGAALAALAARGAAEAGEIAEAEELLTRSYRRLQELVGERSLYTREARERLKAFRSRATKDESQAGTTAR